MFGTLLDHIVRIALAQMAGHAAVKGAKSALGLLWRNRTLSVAYNSLGFILPPASLMEVFAGELVEAAVEKLLDKRANKPAGVVYTAHQSPSGLIYLDTERNMLRHFPLKLPRERGVAVPSSPAQSVATPPGLKLMDAKEIYEQLIEFDYVEKYIRKTGLEKDVPSLAKPATFTPERPPVVLQLETSPIVPPPINMQQTIRTHIRSLNQHMDCHVCKYSTRAGLLREQRCTAPIMNDAGDFVGLPCLR